MNSSKLQTVNEIGHDIGDDSPFLSMADFFSLLSLVLIFLALAVPARAPMPRDAISVLVGRESTDMQAEAANSRFSYVYFEQLGGSVRITIYSSFMPTKIITVPLVVGNLEQPWAAAVKQILDDYSRPDRVMLVLPSDIAEPQVHLRFNQLSRALSDAFPVSIVYLDSGK